MRDKRIGILQVLSSAGLAGGERYVFDLIRFSSPHFKQIVVLPYSGPFEEALHRAEITYYLGGMSSRFSLASLLKLLALIRMHHIKIIHTHGYRANLHGRVAGLLSGTPTVSTVHVSLFDYTDTPPLSRFIYMLLERLTSFKTSKYICISKAMKSDLLRLGISPKKLTLIPNGVDLNRFSQRSKDLDLIAQFGIKGKGPVIGAVGRMVPEKGQIYLIKALSYLKPKYKDLKCVFIGGGPLFPQLKKAASDSGVKEMCVFVGLRQDIEKIYPLFDVFVLPSLREPFGLSLIEAMATGVPVIATNSGGPKDFIRSGINGLLVAPKQPKALAKEIDRLLSDKSFTEELASEGLKTVKEDFNVAKMVDKIESIYRSSVYITPRRRLRDKK